VQSAESRERCVGVRGFSNKTPQGQVGSAFAPLASSPWPTAQVSCNNGCTDTRVCQGTEVLAGQGGDPGAGWSLRILGEGSFCAQRVGGDADQGWRCVYVYRCAQLYTLEQSRGGRTSELDDGKPSHVMAKFPSEVTASISAAWKLLSWDDRWVSGTAAHRRGSGRGSGRPSGTKFDYSAGCNAAGT
jgi:hypothetical protein